MAYYTIDLKSASEDAEKSKDDQLKAFVNLLPSKVQAKLKIAKNCVAFSDWVEMLKTLCLNKGLKPPEPNEPNIKLTSKSDVSITLKLVVEQAAVPQTFRCSNCGIAVSGVMKLSPAHNVIPSALWKKIISCSIELVVEEIKGYDSNFAKSVRVLGDELYGGTRKSKTQWKDMNFTGIHSPDVNEKDWDFMLRLLATGEKTGYASSTDRELGQCGACEQLQKDFSLIQRNRLYSGGSDVTDLNIQFLGKMYIKSPGNAAKSDAPLLNPNDDVLEVTKDAAKKAFEDMKVQIQRGTGQSDLANLLQANLESLEWAVVWFAIFFASKDRPDALQYLESERLKRTGAKK